jgi:hypothetical protein
MWCDGMYSTVLEIDVASSEFCEHGQEQKYSFVQEHLLKSLITFLYITYRRVSLFKAPQSVSQYHVLKYPDNPVSKSY